MANHCCIVNSDNLVKLGRHRGVFGQSSGVKVTTPSLGTLGKIREIAVSKRFGQAIYGHVTQPAPRSESHIVSNFMFIFQFATNISLNTRLCALIISAAQAN
ncbi:hypothetical protein [Sedimentimonas flavescens]|uniref:hypothetical protein n=1 Tax=Sedimentimonas flavescens TaxID=2851012 RepID=UPI001C49FC4E|nr:hypothetical protein [Sedimentimonas flavescens]MBW0158297.1 hypothetical protein [Sedimentimonas flavescens]